MNNNSEFRKSSMIMCYFGGSEDGGPTLGSILPVNGHHDERHDFFIIMWKFSGTAQAPINSIHLHYRDLIGFFKIKIIRLCSFCYRSH